MTMMKTLLAGGAGLAALAVATPASAQYGYPAYGYNPYQANVTQMAAQRCSAAVQARLNQRGTNILGLILGQQSQGRVLSVTQANPRRNMVRVRGLASSGSNYGPYGVGAYGAVGYNYVPDLSFRCDVDYRGRIRDVDINRRR